MGYCLWSALYSMLCNLSFLISECLSIALLLSLPRGTCVFVCSTESVKPIQMILYQCLLNGTYLINSPMQLFQLVIGEYSLQERCTSTSFRKMSTSILSNAPKNESFSHVEKPRRLCLSLPGANKNMEKPGESHTCCSRRFACTFIHHRI
jgi:hypothetical protein